MRRCVIATVSAALLAMPGAAAAQSAFPAGGNDMVVTLGGGLRVQPEFEGSKAYQVVPFPMIGLRFTVNPFTGEPISEFGFGVAPAFRFVGKREVGVGTDLFGLKPIDAALEAGLRLEYSWAFGRAFFELRQGFGGHHGQIADIGADAISDPLPGVKLSVGPRVSFASDDFMDTYFSVSAAQATANQAAGGALTAYNAEGGLRSFGLGGRIDYELTPQWLLRFEGAWNRLAGDAGNSPIVKKAGDANQFSVGFGAAYRFGLDKK